MSYAVKIDGTSWRAIGSIKDVDDGEFFSDVQPDLIKPTLEEKRKSMIVNARQIRLALTAAGLRSAVEEAVDEGGQEIKDWYEYSFEFERLNTHVVAMGFLLKQTPEQIDSLWELAATL